MPCLPKTAAIILAAGFSSRMGAFKPLMSLGSRTVLDRVVDLYVQAGIADIRVVTGHRSGDIRSALAGRPLTVLDNPNYAGGMYSSVVAGVQSLPATTESFCVHPVDIPLVRPHTIRTLVSVASQARATVTVPTFDGQRGHPPLIHSEAVPAIVAHDGSGGLRSVLGRFESDTRLVPVADQGILLDLDRPEDARALTARLERSHFLTLEEGRVLLRSVLRLPAPVDAHCMAVAQVAQALARAVNRGGCHVDIGLITAAARVHDLAKDQPDHAQAGAGLLREMGFPAVADIVAVHMDLAARTDDPLDAAQIVHLADKLVAGDAVVGLAQRFDAKLKKYGRDPDIAARIRKRKQAALMIEEKIVHCTGNTLAEILQQAGVTGGSEVCRPS